jgi:general secretion pathway protein A
MYYKHFGLKKNPFLLNTSSTGIYYSASHCETIAQLLYAVRECRGIVLLTGEAGTGKTTLLHTVLNLVRPTGAVTSVILNPMMETAQELLFAVLTGFKVNSGQRPAMELAGMLFGFLADQARHGRRAILVVDEAQQLSSPMLENLRLISNVENNGERMIQLILSAQPEIRQVIASSHHAALRQRIVARCSLQTLQPFEIWNYLALRSAWAGSDGRMIFLPEAVDSLATASACTPRLINVLADNCLIAAYAKGMDTVDAALVGRVASDFDLIADAVPSGNHVRAPADRTPESWKKLVTQYASYGVPEALQNFASTLKSGQLAD